ncbi:hypothetical protein SAMN04488245_11226 [Alloyangia pacifica]|uniref:Uncharacterized protein n=1 Tax=Alloyangia pacifica TaxID=311180 RepID=A0A1I6VMM2_9RHOB|nr:hypothetical protein SAMN04488245_11226 [Alloyangia pacifica]SFT14982.1 hypothetical protein SAMN04488050_11226 [Alloyangia pacifica]
MSGRDMWMVTKAAVPLLVLLTLLALVPGLASVLPELMRSRREAPHSQPLGQRVRDPCQCDLRRAT